MSHGFQCGLMEVVEGTLVYLERREREKGAYQAKNGLEQGVQEVQGCGLSIAPFPRTRACR